MGRPTRRNKVLDEVEGQIRAILENQDLKVSERLMAVNSWIKLIDLRRDLKEEEEGDFYGDGRR